MPCQVLTVEDAVADGHVLALPEGVFRHDVRLVDFHILTILEHVLGVALQVVDAYVLAEHEGIGAVVQLQVRGLDVLAAPKGLVGIVDDHVLQLQVFHLAEHLRSVYACVTHHEVVGIPEGRPCPCIELTALHKETVDMPQRVLPPEVTVHDVNVGTFLDGTLALANGHMLQPQVVALEERTLSLKMLVPDNLHIFSVVGQRYAFSIKQPNFYLIIWWNRK